MFDEAEMHELENAHATLGRILRAHETHASKIATEEAEKKAKLVSERLQREIDADTADN